MNTIDLNGRVAVITGGARGIGFAAAERFLASGAAVALWDMNPDTLDAAKARLAGKGTVLTQTVNVADYGNVEAAAAEVVSDLGRLDLLVNAAGIAGATVPMTDYPVDVWAQVMAVNVAGIFHTCRACVPHMQKNDYGRIANIASMAGKDGNPNASGYSTSKAAVIGLTKSLGKELATSNIRANVVCPAVIQTEMLDDITEEQIAYMVAKIPMGRTGKTEEIAALLAWMCSEECSYSTGAVFDFSGGRATY
ncbi:SDR family NAD(P)-dependent oxidoreductase [Jannaschia sp. M317]|uniref:SDR family NAD(P)-dependent oxidoreductase n=1 Tax=Jannaschia sp. M317 TaxID=2867011 RepID=UPI0021A263ED|nr:SDR family NAD(P)-dependent oxidoreductase [Jannaschia sp. M317]UWQ17230.1 SDR family oxidoreductase [Jannaschia sp. M317]